jgi:hypothetical protein
VPLRSAQPWLARYLAGLARADRWDRGRRPLPQKLVQLEGLALQRPATRGHEHHRLGAAKGCWPPGTQIEDDRSAAERKPST